MIQAALVAVLQVSQRNFSRTTNSDKQEKRYLQQKMGTKVVNER